MVAISVYISMALDSILDGDHVPHGKFSCSEIALLPLDY